MIFEPCFHADKIYPPREKKNVYKRKSDKNYCGQTWNHSAPNSDHFKGSFVDFRMEMTFTLPKLLWEFEQKLLQKVDFSFGDIMIYPCYLRHWKQKTELIKQV